jgi:hypothetical protein
MKAIPDTQFFGTKLEDVEDDSLPLGYTTTNLIEIVPVTIILRGQGSFISYVETKVGTV